MDTYYTSPVDPSSDPHVEKLAQKAFGNFAQAIHPVRVTFPAETPQTLRWTDSHGADHEMVVSPNDLNYAGNRAWGAGINTRLSRFLEIMQDDLRRSLESPPSTGNAHDFIAKRSALPSNIPTWKLLVIVEESQLLDFASWLGAFALAIDMRTDRPDPPSKLSGFMSHRIGQPHAEAQFHTAEGLAAWWRKNPYEP